MAFATPQQVATRLGQDALTAIQETQADQLIDAVTGMITDAAGKTDAWADALDPVPRALKALTIEIVARVMSNPSTAKSISENLGTYSYTQVFVEAGLGLSVDEVALIRRTVYPATEAGGVELDGLVSDPDVQRAFPSLARQGTLEDLGEDDPAFWLA